MPAIEIHNPAATRTEELKLGLHLDAAATPAQIRDAAYILADATIASRVRQMMEMIQLANGQKLAGALILAHLNREMRVGLSSTSDVGLDRLTDT
jgi:UDP:flavonoid glycosyltransferase YjiC (YdhE family)